LTVFITYHSQKTTCTPARKTINWCRTCTDY